MIYKTRRPGPLLAPYIEFLWYFDELEADHSSERVLPHGCFELIIDLSDLPRKLFTNCDQTAWRAFRGGWLAGAQSKFIVIDVLPRSSMIGAHFRPGGAAAFLDFPADDLADRIEEIDEIWGATALQVRDNLMNTPTPEAKFAVLERYLESKLSASPPRWLRPALQFAAAVPASSSLSDLASQFGLSHKQFIAQFRAAVGLTPKRYCRILRFQNALLEIERSQKLEWASLAADAGYYDQSHLIHDFIAFSGLNPSRYLTERGEHLNFVPIGDPR